jgi:radical SAM protein (TIGR01212 family)
VASTLPPCGGNSAPDWRSAGLRYYPLRHYLHQQFGGRVWRVSVDAGLGCPNRDGTIAHGGCVFCDPASFSPSRRLGIPSLTGQIAEGTRRLAARSGAERFLAYFQPATNTYAPTARLRALYDEALAQPQIVGLVIGTRPDCVPDDVLDLLAEFASRTWLAVEYGLQSIHQRSLTWMNRGHGPEAFVDAVKRSQARGLRVGAHVILGLPGESLDEVRATAIALGQLGIHSVKLHNLHAVRGTPLGDWVAAGQIHLPDLTEYVPLAVDFLERLPPNCVIDRLVGDAPADCLIAPAWCRNKSAAQRAIDAELTRRDTWQGRLWTTR